MYELPAYMPQSCTVKPVDVMYSLPSYHKTNGVEESASEVVMIDPVQLIEQKQKELIDALNGIGENLNALLQKKGKEVKITKPNKAESTSKDKKDKGSPKEASPSSSAALEKGTKMDKDAKKEARKAAKADAKNKVASKNTKTTGSAQNSAQWIVKEDKLSTETNQSLTACLPPVLTDFPVNGYVLDSPKLKITKADLPWVIALSVIGQKRGAAFSGEVNTSVKNAKTTVEVSLGDKFSFTVKDLVLTTRVAAWKLIGQALGLFSLDHTQTVHAAHQHEWLQKADAVLNGRSCASDILREASQYLSRFDSLSSYFTISLADFVVCSLFAGDSLPNNVELWKQRVEKVKQ